MSAFAMTEDQRACVAMLTEWVGGAHHLPKVRDCGSGVAINFFGDLSTFDGGRLTSLVVLAHRDAVRIEIQSSGPRMVKVVAHKRRHMPKGRVWERHPGLEDLVELCRRAQS